MWVSSVARTPRWVVLLPKKSTSRARAAARALSSAVRRVAKPLKFAVENNSAPSVKDRSQFDIRKFLYGQQRQLDSAPDSFLCQYGKGLPTPGAEGQETHETPASFATTTIGQHRLV